MQSHTAEIRLEGPLGDASSMWSEIEEWRVYGQVVS